MTAQRENMLEAFRKAGGDPQTPDPLAESAALPVETPLTGSSPASKAGLPMADLRPSRLPVTLPGLLIGVVFLGLAFAAGVLVGRGDAGAGEAVQAAESAPDGGQGRAPGTAPRGAGLVPVGTNRALAPAVEEPEDGSQATSALLDPRNQYTIQVVTYGATQQDLAFAAYDHLAGEGLPVFHPYRVGSNIVLLVGAAPRSEDLEELERRVHSLSRDGIPGVYGDAFRILIDRYVDR